uniref:Uncharacterized protein n=1 Tax=Brassica oleracea TaxID=3712 RepID=A0A3P6DZF5_BRAOL|nr:unnamed protein product [Brassica oleracea]
MGFLHLMLICRYFSLSLPGRMILGNLGLKRLCLLF